MMMRYLAPKRYQSFTLKQHVRYFTTRPEDRVLMGVRGTHDEDLLYRRFIAAETADLIEKIDKAPTKLRAKVLMASRYRDLIALHRFYAELFFREQLIGYLKAFALGEKYAGLQEQVDIKAKTVYSKTASSVVVMPALKVSSKISIENATSLRSKPAVSPKLPSGKASLKVKSEGRQDTRLIVKPPTKNPPVFKKIPNVHTTTPQVREKSEEVYVIKTLLPMSKTQEELEIEAGIDRAAAEMAKRIDIKPEDIATVYSSPRAILSGERKMPPGPSPANKSKLQKSEKYEIDPALTALIEKARAKGKRTSSFLSPEEIPYLIKDSQVHKTLFFLGTSYMFYNYPNTIYYTAYIMFAYFVYLCVSRYNKYMVWISKDFEYAKFLSWSSEAYQRDLHRRMQARYPHKVKNTTSKSGGKK